ncbi:hypothetical protein BC938DRAFT_478970 [Jimgerdemannia flammicorona]|uniref:Uncharacterized protein n=1 Tax=Jimgerdemannia flammicorona TaxID=994334 RepID=A0A433QLY3_9FUNG|nr:hypothetical protein BC938DRAFT_478970 [Jimgerdemannia flammicorona]
MLFSNYCHHRHYSRNNNSTDPIHYGNASSSIGTAFGGGGGGGGGVGGVGGVWGVRNLVDNGAVGHEGEVGCVKDARAV